MEDIGRYQRMDILQKVSLLIYCCIFNLFVKSDNNDTQLLKLLHITNLLATCCEGHQKYAEEKCQEIFSLEEILESVYIIRNLLMANILTQNINQ